MNCFLHVVIGTMSTSSEPYNELFTMAPTPKLFKVRKSLHHYIGSLRDNVIYSDLHLHGCDHMYNHKNTNHEVKTNE